MSKPLKLYPDRLFPVDERTRDIARELYRSVRDLPIVSPHGHTDPAWFAHDLTFEDADSLLLWPDHYLLRMLHGAGVALETIGLKPRDGGAFTSVRGFPGVPQRNIRFAPTFVRTYAQEWEKLDQLRRQVEAGQLTLRVAETYPPERARDAHRRLEAGGTRGRLIIQFP